MFTHLFIFLERTSVGDADNFRLYHTPGFGWRGPLKFRHIPSTKSKRGARPLLLIRTHKYDCLTNNNDEPINDVGLTKGTIHIRMAGMDAPEVSEYHTHIIRYDTIRYESSPSDPSFFFPSVHKQQ